MHVRARLFIYQELLTDGVTAKTFPYSGNPLGVKSVRLYPQYILLGCPQVSGTPGHCRQYILCQIKGWSQEKYRLKASVFILRPPPSSGFAHNRFPSVLKDGCRPEDSLLQDGVTCALSDLGWCCRRWSHVCHHGDAHCTRGSHTDPPARPFIKPASSHRCHPANQHLFALAADQSNHHVQIQLDHIVREHG